MIPLGWYRSPRFCAVLELCEDVLAGLRHVAVFLFAVFVVAPLALGAVLLLLVGVLKVFGGVS